MADNRQHAAPTLLLVACVDAVHPVFSLMQMDGRLRAAALCAVAACVLLTPARGDILHTFPPACEKEDTLGLVRMCTEFDSTGKLFMFPSDRTTGWDPSFFRVSTVVSDLRQLTVDGFAVTPIIRSWKNCGFVTNSTVTYPNTFITRYEEVRGWHTVKNLATRDAC